MARALRHAMFLARAHDRVLQAGLAQLNAPVPTALRTASHAYQVALDDLTQRAGTPHDHPNLTRYLRLRRSWLGW
jgi:phytoene/squalene synthetase